MNSRCIITSASNKYFPSVINLIGSLKANFPEHPQIYIYDLGLNGLLRKQLENIEGIKILKMPKFVNYWRCCYTWKTYILNTPLADLNFYLDAGCQVLRPLDEIFEKIETNGYLFVSQGKEVLAKDIVPRDYIDLFELKNEQLDHEVIAAGIFGFKKNSLITIITNKLYAAGVSGLCLGFSEKEQWKNKGVNKNNFIRNCKRFRHDTTLLTLFILKHINVPTIESLNNFQGELTKNPNQIIWNLRMNYSKLDYIFSKDFSSFTRLYISCFIKFKKINSWIKLRK